MDFEERLDSATKAKYRQYRDEIIRVLQSFDEAAEWADLIKCIQKLHKVIQRSTSCHCIPEGLTVAKRLAQCLNPNLPSGVHIKALETYEAIFDNTQGNLYQDIIIFSAGLFPFFQYASTQVKPKVLKLISQFYLPLNQRLESVLPGLVQGLLPGLEEENTTPYELTLEIFNKLAEGPTSEAFFKAIWRCLLFSSSTSRLCALNYFLQKFTKSPITSPETWSQMLPDKSNLVVPALIHSLQDQNVLVLRSTLELLALHFQVHLNQFENDEYVSLLRAAVRPLLRREMAISRRFYCWILGITNINSGIVSDSGYYPRYVRDYLSKAVQELFAIHPQKKSEVNRPFRILTCLLERAEVGADILKDIIVDILRYASRCKDDEQIYSEISRSFPKLLDQVKSDAIWSKLEVHLAEELQTCMDDESPKLEVTSLVKLVLEIIVFLEAEVQQKYLPRMFLLGAEKLQPLINRSRIYPVIQIIDLLQLMFKKLPQNLIFDNDDSSFQEARAIMEQAIGSFHVGYCDIVKFTIEYVAQHEGGTFAKVMPIADMPSTPSKNIDSDYICLLKSSTSLLLSLSCKKYGYLHDVSQKNEPEDITKFIKSIRNRVALISTGPPDQQTAIPTWMNSVVLAASSASVIPALIGISAYLKLVFSEHISPNLARYIFLKSDFSTRLTRRLWDLLDNKYNPCCFDVVNLLLGMNEMNPDSTRSVVAEGISQKDPHKRLDGYKRLAKLWNISCSFGLTGVFQNGIWLLLDGLKDQSSSIQQFCSTWLIDSLDNSERLLIPILFILMDHNTRRGPSLLYEVEYDTRRARYAFQTLQNMLQIAGKKFFNSLQGKPVAPEIMDALKTHLSFDIEASLIRSQTPVHEFTYLVIILDITLRFMRSKPKEALTNFDIANALVRVHSIHLLRTIIADTDASEYVSLEAKEKVKQITLKTLEDVTNSPQSTLQVELLRLLEVLLPWAKKNEEPSLRNTLKLATSNPTQILSADLLTYGIDSQIVISVLNNAFSNTEKDISIRPWIEFLGSVLPSLGKSLSSFVKKIVPLICQSMDELLRKPDIRGQGQIVYVSDLILYINGLIIIMNFCYGRNLVDTEMIGDEGSSQTGKASFVPFPARSLFEMIRNMIPGETTFFSNADDPRISFVQTLPKISATIIRLWSVFGEETPQVLAGEKDVVITEKPEILHIMKFIRAIILYQSKVFFTTFPETIDELNRNFNRQECINVACRILHHNSIPREKVIGPLAETIKPLLNHHANHETSSFEKEHLYLSFLLAYLNNCPNPYLVDMWPQFSSILKEAIHNSTNPHTFLYLFRSICAFNRGLSHEKRGVRKELQDITQRIIDFCAMFAGGSFEISMIIGPRTNEASNGSKVEQVSASASSSRTKGSVFDVKDYREQKMLITFEALRTLSDDLAQLTDELFEDKERMATIIGATLSRLYVHIRQIDHSDYRFATTVLGFMNQLTSYQHAFKTWKREVWDIFMKCEVFHVPVELLRKWRKIIHDIINHEQSLFSELLAKPSTSIQTPVILFANRENENATRIRLLRRLSFVIFCGEVDQYHGVFGEIQEKIAECIKASATVPGLIIHVLLCVRVLMVRMSRENLTSLWPTVINEVIRILVENKDLDSILAACKFIDFAIAVLPEEFHFFEWMFVVDPAKVAQYGAYSASVHSNSSELPKETLSIQPLMWNVLRGIDAAGLEALSDDGISYHGSNGLRRPHITTKIATKSSIAQGIRNISISCVHPSPHTASTLECDSDFIEKYFLQEFSDLDFEREELHEVADSGSQDRVVSDYVLVGGFVSSPLMVRSARPMSVSKSDHAASSSSPKRDGVEPTKHTDESAPEVVKTSSTNELPVIEPTVTEVYATEESPEAETHEQETANRDETDILDRSEQSNEEVAESVEVAAQNEDNEVTQKEDEPKPVENQHVSGEDENDAIEVSTTENETEIKEENQNENDESLPDKESAPEKADEDKVHEIQNADVEENAADEGNEEVETVPQ